MNRRFAYNYHTDENITYLANQIQNQVVRLRPDYLKIEQLANEIIKYCKQGIKYNGTKRI